MIILLSFVGFWLSWSRVSVASTKVVPCGKSLPLRMIPIISGRVPPSSRKKPLSRSRLQSLSSAEAPYGKLNDIGSGRARGERCEEGKGGNFSSLFSLPGVPRALPFFPLHSLHQPTIKAARKRPQRKKEQGSRCWMVHGLFLKSKAHLLRGNTAFAQGNRRWIRLFKVRAVICHIC